MQMGEMGGMMMKRIVGEIGVGWGIKWRLFLGRGRNLLMGDIKIIKSVY